MTTCKCLWKYFIYREGQGCTFSQEFSLSVFNISLAHPLVHWSISELLESLSSIFTSLSWFSKMWIFFFALLCKTETHCLNVPGSLRWRSVSLLSSLHGSWSSCTKPHRFSLLLCSTAFYRSIYLLIFLKILFSRMSRMTGPLLWNSILIARELFRDILSTIREKI